MRAYGANRLALSSLCSITVPLRPLPPPRSYRVVSLERVTRQAVRGTDCAAASLFPSQLGLFICNTTGSSRVITPPLTVNAASFARQVARPTDEPIIP